MTDDDDIDMLLAAYCEGLYAMDPRTTYPFWDYDMAPLFSGPWAKKILAATTAAASILDPSDYPRVFGGPSVPRKELIYSLVDLKVARIPREERLRQVKFWTGILRTWCGDDWLSSSANRSPQQDHAGEMLTASHWVHNDRAGGRAVGELVVTLNALAYSLYSDVFVHQCAESRGPYNAPSDGRQEMLVRSWTGLRPSELLSDAQDVGFESALIASVYDNCPFSIDIYNHVSWANPPVRHLVRYAVWLDGVPQRLTTEGMAAMARRIADVAADTFRRYQAMDFEAKKLLWVRQRNYQFRYFFALAGLPAMSAQMETAVRGYPLVRSPLWNMSLPKQDLFKVWIACLDPRNEIYADDWTDVFRMTFGDHQRA